MTPLAHRLVKDFCCPLREQKHHLGQHGHAVQYLRLLDDVHFFNVEAVYEAACALAEGLGKDERSRLLTAERYAFLPAPRIFMEVVSPISGLRAGWLMEQVGDHAEVRSIFEMPDGDIGIAEGVVEVPLRGDSRLGTVWYRDGAFAKAASPRDALETASMMLLVVYALLAMINTPRVIGRRSHMPHAGLQRKLAAARGMVGKFPLRAWTEIVLEVKPPQMADEKEHEVRLSGGKALHFCRAYLRFNNGTLQLVSAHWRGDPALGICKTRYRVTLPKAA